MTHQSAWRAIAAPIIANIISTVGRDDPQALRRALREAYPWGERRMHPYRIWCNEIRRQLQEQTQRPRRAPAPAPGQISLLPPE